MRKFLSLLLLAAAAPPGPAPGAAPPAAADGDAHELVLLHGKRPYRVRFHLRMGGHSFQAGWNRQMARLFAYLDADGDGRLSPAEASHAPSLAQWRQLSAGEALLDPDAAPDFARLAGGKKSATLADLQTYYAASTAGPLHASYSWPLSAADPLSDALWRRLDRNKDGRLSKAELLAARRVLEALDLDDDDMISQSELMGFGYGEPGAAASPGPAHGPAAGGLPFFSFRPGESPAALARVLLARYGRGGARAVSRAEVGLPEATFARLDRDGDGRLDEAELAGWACGPPDLELLVPLEGPDRPVRVLAGPSPGLGYRATRRGESIVVGDWQVELARPAPRLPQGKGKAVAYLSAFRALDRDSNGYLDSKEIYQPPFEYVAWFRLADRDGDGRLTAKEFADFAELQAGIRGRVTFLRVESRGRSLYRIVDHDGDGRLAPRELIQAWERLAPWDRGKGHLERGWLPQHHRVTIGYGALVPRPLNRYPGDLAPARRPPLQGPLWFQKMDRNRDGDVSLKEWLGSVEQFRRIDTDGDGLISLEEAERYDRRLRGGRE
jgi:Ca2+-binding EF-hand superfamily protein